MKTVFDINGKYYEMEEKDALKIASFGKDKMKMGIYCVYKEGYCKALIERYIDINDLNVAITKYREKGFKVLYNM